MPHQKHGDLTAWQRLPKNGIVFEGLVFLSFTPSLRLADCSQDRELWDENADCLIHFYAQGSSQRGPSLKISFKAVEASGSSYLLEQCLVRPEDRRSTTATANGSDSGYDSSETPESQAHELYVPAPVLLTREQAYSYHVTTRNYFAFLTGQALVGEKLGLALTDLWTRAREWQGEDATTEKLLEFCEAQGYLRITGNPHWTTAVLNLAESARLSDLWIHAYVHCVGMHHKQDLSPEFDSLSNMTKALVTRASLEMDLHITRVIRAFGTFLDAELSTENLGLSRPARDHLDRFRSFLHTYYVDKLGYFPPSASEPFDKKLWLNMQKDFQSLYDYLVDTESDMQPSNRGAIGGVCVLQNVQAFDSRHGYESLPHPLPLLPQTSLSRATSHQNGLRSFRLGRSESKLGETSRLPPRMALAKATNHSNKEAMSSGIVQEYQRFEKQRLEERIHIAEARKVRWLLIYGVLQMLTSITRAPKEVKDYDAASYPLCVLTAGCPPWKAEKPTEESTPVQAPTDQSTPLEEAEKFSIRPDCDADCAEDYFSLSRQPSLNALDMAPAPLRITVPLSRTASIRSSVHSGVNALQRSVVGSFNRRNSVRRRSASMSVRRPPSFAEILVDGYGNGADEQEAVPDEEERAHEDGLAQLEGETPKPYANQFAAFDFGLNDVAEEPALDTRQMDNVFGLSNPRMLSPEPILDFSQLDNAPAPSRPAAARPASASSIRDSWVSESAFTAHSPSDSDSPISARSSYTSSCDTPATELSFTNSPISTAKTSLDLPITSTKRPSHSQRHLGGSTTSLNAGTYMPTGMKLGTYQPSDLRSQTSVVSFRPAVSRFSSVRRDSSADSSHSSVYPEHSLQADEIEEEELRGRRKSRALDGMAKFSFGFEL